VSWLNSVFLKASGEIGHVRPTCPFLVFTDAPDGVRYDFFDARLGERIPWDQIRDDREAYDV